MNITHYVKIADMTKIHAKVTGGSLILFVSGASFEFVPQTYFGDISAPEESFGVAIGDYICDAIEEACSNYCGQLAKEIANG